MTLVFETLPDKQVEKIAVEFLSESLERYEVLKWEIRTDTDFDDQRVFRLDMYVADRVPTEVAIKEIGALHQHLRAKGEYRFIYVNIYGPEENVHIENGAVRTEDVD